MSSNGHICPNIQPSIRDDHRECMTFNWNKQPIYRVPFPWVKDIERETPPTHMTKEQLVKDMTGLCKAFDRGA